MKRLPRLTLTASAALVGALTCAALTGCAAAAHPLATEENACIKCHAATYAAAPGATYSMAGAAYSVTGNVAVTLEGAKNFYLCTPVASNQGEGKFPIPVLQRGPIPVAEGTSYDLTLEPGAYILLIQGEGKVASQLLIVDAAATQNVVDAVNLSL